MPFIVVLIILVILYFLLPSIIKTFGNETFDSSKDPGKMIRTTPEQKARRVKFFLVIAIVIVLFIGIKSCLY